MRATATAPRRPDGLLPERETEPYGALLERAGVPVRVLTGGRLGARPCALRRALAADRIDVVHAWLFIANAFAWAATRFGGPRARHLGAQLQALRAACSTR